MASSLQVAGNDFMQRIREMEGGQDEIVYRQRAVGGAGSSQEFLSSQRQEESWGFCSCKTTLSEKCFKLGCLASNMNFQSVSCSQGWHGDFLATQKH